jgi:hypothetical protein
MFSPGILGLFIKKQPETRENGKTCSGGGRLSPQRPWLHMSWECVTNGAIGEPKAQGSDMQ